MTSKTKNATKGKLKSISEFEWASVGRYLVYVAAHAGLTEIDSQRVRSFPLARHGPEKLLKHKEQVKRALERNISALELFVGEKRAELGKDELSILRGLYIQHKVNLETVSEHIAKATVYRNSIDVSLFDAAEEEDNEFPF